MFRIFRDGEKGCRIMSLSVWRRAQGTCGTKYRKEMKNHEKRIGTGFGAGASGRDGENGGDRGANQGTAQGFGWRV